MIKKIFHGSTSIVNQPIYGFGKKYNDYGIGFYCTENIDLAKEWSVKNNSDGYANEYEIEIENLSILNLNDNKYCILHWLAILIQNREFDSGSALAEEAKRYILDNFLIDYKEYDIIIGFRADDSYFSFAQDFINGAISYRQLANAMKLGNLGEQFVIKSEKAFKQIKFISSMKVKASEWYFKANQRDINARRDYFDFEKNKRLPGDLYVAQIIDERINENDSRLR